MRYQLNDGKFSIIGSNIHFHRRIKQALEIGDYIILNEAFDRTSPSSRNVFAVNLDGKEIWRIEESPMKDEEFSYYINIFFRNGQLVANHFSGVNYFVDPENGRITPDPDQGRYW